MYVPMLVGVQIVSGVSVESKAETLDVMTATETPVMAGKQI